MKKKNTNKQTSKQTKTILNNKNKKNCECLGNSATLNLNYYLCYTVTMTKIQLLTMLRNRK